MPAFIVIRLIDKLMRLLRKKKRKKTHERTAEQPETKSSNAWSTLPFPLSFAAVWESLWQHQPPAQLASEVCGSAQVIQPGPEAGVWVVFLWFCLEIPKLCRKG